MLSHLKRGCISVPGALVGKHPLARVGGHAVSSPADGHHEVVGQPGAEVVGWAAHGFPVASASTPKI